MGPPTTPTKTRWGDDMDDSDDEDSQQVGSAAPSALAGGSKAGGGGHHVSFASGPGALLKIPPTHKSRIDSNGVQIVTSYRANPSNKSQLLKTVTKVKVETVKVREAKAVATRREWAKFGQAKRDESSGTKTTVQSKDEILLEDPHADTDLQDEDPAAAIAGNLNAFWAKQQRRQLERKYDVQVDDGMGGGAGGPAGGDGGAGGWTQVGSKLAGAAGGGPAKYVPPAARAGLAASSSAMMAGAAAMAAEGYKPDRRDDLNTLRVTNLSENTTEADLQELFQRFGRISRVYLAKDKETLQSRGFAFVSFVNKDDAAKAMEELQGYGTCCSCWGQSNCTVKKTCAFHSPFPLFHLG
jgi:translation initiation factor 3 subunit G